MMTLGLSTDREFNGPNENIINSSLGQANHPPSIKQYQETVNQVEVEDHREVEALGVVEAEVIVDGQVVREVGASPSSTISKNNPNTKSGHTDNTINTSFAPARTGAP